jgi:hypothetical protein
LDGQDQLKENLRRIYARAVHEEVPVEELVSVAAKEFWDSV